MYINWYTLVVNGGEPESSGASFRVNWETFDEELVSTNEPKKSSPETTTPAESTVPERVDSPLHNTLGYALPLPKKPEEPIARRTPPPLPKPYARSKNGGNQSKLLSEPTTICKL